ncbi:MAG: response regulator [Anaerolineae bacterium]|nr:response regulator [Anaerolineae bacterium]
MSLHILILDADAVAAQVTEAGVRRALPEATRSGVSDVVAGGLSGEGGRPDALIIDPAPHNLASAWLIQAFKAENPDALVIVLASAPTPNLQRTLNRLGVDVYLEKPVSLPILLQALLASLRVPGSNPPLRAASAH